MKNLYFLYFLSCLLFFIPGKEEAKILKAHKTLCFDSLHTKDLIFVYNIGNIELKKELLYDRHTLADSYNYNRKKRYFQWEKIKNRLAIADSLRQFSQEKWGVLQNYKNTNGTAALIQNYHRNNYGNIADKYGIERYQNIALYIQDDLEKPVRYALDGSLVRLLEIPTDSLSYVLVETTTFPGKWMINPKYLKYIHHPLNFTQVIMVDKTNQNITTLEKGTEPNIWLIRSMNPATTGKNNPPLQKETPNGIFLIQEKKRKMYYLSDHTHKIAGYAPYASRFTAGGYLHGVPLNYPNNIEREFSSSLGTVPRSHMCVRNATSHAKFIYNWAEVNNTLIFVFE